MSIVVSDTSPVRALDFLRLLTALKDVYGTVLIPPAVEQELRNPGADFAPIDVRSLANFQIAAPEDLDLINRLRARLDFAESEALVLALERSAGAVLIDETAGRAVAEELGLKTTGTVGVLLEMKLRGIIPRVAPLLYQLKHELDFFLGDQFVAEVIKRAGEDTYT